MLKSLSVKPIEPLKSTSSGSSQKITSRDRSEGGEFAKALNAQVERSSVSSEASGGKGLRFSNHAIDRIRSRGITVRDSDVLALSSAVEKAAQKGSKNTLVLGENSAWIVNVDQRTVVTVMDKEMLKENVFTNIDSTIVM